MTATNETTDYLECPERNFSHGEVQICKQLICFHPLFKKHDSEHWHPTQHLWQIKLTGMWEEECLNDWVWGEDLHVHSTTLISSVTQKWKVVLQRLSSVNSSNCVPTHTFCVKEKILLRWVSLYICTWTSVIKKMHCFALCIKLYDGNTTVTCSGATALWGWRAANSMATHTKRK